MNRTDTNLVKIRLQDASQIHVGLLVAFVVGTNPENGKRILSRGFIRSIHNGFATIPNGSGTYRVRIDPEFIRYSLVKPA